MQGPGPPQSTDSYLSVGKQWCPLTQHTNSNGWEESPPTAALGGGGGGGLCDSC